eukprot:COSAG02_NODE_31183_length_538_cov_0.612756_1_plen_38_part_10
MQMATEPLLDLLELKLVHALESKPQPEPVQELVLVLGL